MWSTPGAYLLPPAWTHPPPHAVAHRRHPPPPTWSAPRRRLPSPACGSGPSDVDSLYELDASDRYSLASSRPGLPPGDAAVAADDPRLSLTYGEFPLRSFDAAFRYARRELGDD
eukprot:CAMPEP_0194286010 /NCGR_PEP_ID=MMETSP0169-20130528/31609_1 /TAXON_ID=218684 /ORGANISM="Corethron pennatum, Strain L29A3" /LENGTH=113 /DNA_ID=CAMNT_0039032305 /DNA_START=86 /DNA_END=424 /DNA_ORIENTATION=-